MVATGETHSVADFCQAAFAAVGLEWRDHVDIDARYFRPAEVDLLLGDSTKARTVLGWSPRVTFPQLVQMMVAADAEAAERERRCA